jgi:hypothetical protein
MTPTSSVGFPKGMTQRAYVKRKRSRKKATDYAENRKVKKRSGHVCEVKERGHMFPDYFFRCSQYAMPGVHHLIFGRGKRNVGRSILAECKIAICPVHSLEIHEHLLNPVEGCDPTLADSVRYERKLR